MEEVIRTPHWFLLFGRLRLAWPCERPGHDSDNRQYQNQEDESSAPATAETEKRQ
jgi:hypothetical protein